MLLGSETIFGVAYNMLLETTWCYPFILMGTVEAHYIPHFLALFAAVCQPHQFSVKNNKQKPKNSQIA